MKLLLKKGKCSTITLPYNFCVYPAKAFRRLLDYTAWNWTVQNFCYLYYIRPQNICVFQVSALKKLAMVGGHNILFYKNIFIDIAFFSVFSLIFHHFLL